VIQDKDGIVSHTLKLWWDFAFDWCPDRLFVLFQSRWVHLP